MDVEGSIKSDLASAAQSERGTLTPRRYQSCFVLNTTLPSIRWRGSFEVCSSTTTEEPHTAIVHPLLVRLPDG